MSNTTGFNTIREQLNGYKRKYHLNALIRGFILLIAMLSGLYILLTTLEYFGRFSTLLRAAFLLVFLGAGLASLIKWVVIPIYHIINLSRGISDEEAARQIGIAFPNIGDKLLNALQINSLSSSQGDLISASLAQRTEELRWYKFPKAVKFSDNRRFLKYVLGPIMIIVAVGTFVPELFSESTERIINYNKTYVPQAPFKIQFGNEELRAFRNDDFELIIEFEGSLVPDNAFILNGDRRIRLKRLADQSFSYTWRKVQSNEAFQIQAAGFTSENYELEVIPKPELQSFFVNLDYPDYTGVEDEQLSNIGNIVAPEGTNITWNLRTKDASGVTFVSDSSSDSFKNQSDKSSWKYGKRLNTSFDYTVSLISPQNIQRDLMSYSVKSVKDQFPYIRARQVYDSTLFNYIVLGGEINDDYGFSQFHLKYIVYDEEKTPLMASTRKVDFSSDLKTQNYIYNWNIDTLNLEAGQTLEYYLEVFDNDAINGPKSTKTQSFIVALPDKSEIRENSKRSSESLQNDLNQVQEQARELNDELNKLLDDTKSKKSLEWKDKNKIDQVLKKHEELKKQIEDINKKMDKNIQSKERFEKQNDDIREKTESLQNLMNEILDEETKDLLRELQKLLENKSNKNQIENQLENLEDKSFNIEKELDRAIEMFKQLQFEERMDQAVQDLNELAEKQEELAEQTENKYLNNKELKEKQDALNEEFKDLQQEMKDLKDLDESMENPNDMDEMEEEQSDIDQSMQESSDQLEKNKNKKASESQKKASDQMKEMSKSMSDFMMGMQSQNLMEDMNNLRQILENLLTLSFDQEEVMKEFKKVNQSDPRYVELGQQQLKLKDDAAVIQDSLFALAKRVFQIESFVTREVNDMNDNIEDALEAIKDRKNGLAAAKQQFAMTSINNLALMLNDVLKQMQEQMASQMEGDQMCNKPKQGGKPSLSMLQQQLNEQIRQLKQSGKSGRELSEGLAELAREQEELRKMLDDLGSGEGQLDKDGQQKLSDLGKIMEESENDLVHKRLTQELLARQEKILTRLLESEKAQREQKMDPTREAQTADDLKRDLPPDLEKYFDEKEKQTELLKTISPFLNSYYRERVNEYFEKIYD